MTEPGTVEPTTAEVRTEKPPTEPSNNGDGPGVEVAAALAAAEAASKRRRWPVLVLGVILGGVGTWAGLTYLGGSDESDVIVGEEVSLAVAEVTRQDLLEEIEWSGTLGYGESVSGSGGVGTVTSAAPTGLTVDRGDVIAAVDNVPVVVFFGDTPLWRDVSAGDEGHDVFLLETNLAALGYDSDQTVDIDQVFTANTELMVERWQEDLGIEATGEVPLGTVVIVEGPSSLVSVGAIGTAANGELASLAPRRAVTDVVAAIDGTVTGVLSIGSPVDHGVTLYHIDEVPIVALTRLDPVSAVLDSNTFTATELEQALTDNGYDPDEEMTVDGNITSATRTAVERWQAAAGLPVTGESDPGYYLLVPEGRTVDSILMEDGATVATGGPILTASVSRLSVEVVVDITDADQFEVGQPVTIELADETLTEGTVANISSVIQAANPQDSPTVEISINVLSAADQDLIEGPVTVLSIGDAIEGATVVPTRSLLSLAEGGFAVEKVNADGSTSLIAIELGTFDDGVVEVLEGDLAPGDEVIVPR